MYNFTSDSSVAIAMAMIEGHHRFLEANTGTTNDASVDHFVLNPEGVLSNNRHFIGRTQQQYQPNGDATTEGQSLLILGYLYAYFATKNPKYLTAATKYWDAYVEFFYAGQPPPYEERWIANWIVNGKEPVLANSPVNTVEPPKGGYKGVLISFTAGLGAVPHGTPTWGQYLDVATFAFTGDLNWDAINASVTGTKYDVDWIIAWTGEKVDSNGTVLETGFTGADIGKVKLKNTSITGDYKFNYATRQPVENGGTLIGRNEVQHNRPLHTPLLGSIYQRSNAADGEEWFADACFLMYKATGNGDYMQAFNAVFYTLKEFVTLPLFTSPLKYFEEGMDPKPIFTSNSYDYIYPPESEGQYNTYRDVDGWIYSYIGPTGSKYSLEHSGVDVSLTETSVFSVDIGCSSSTAIVEVVITVDETSTGLKPVYRAVLAPIEGQNPYNQSIPAEHFVRTTPLPLGNPFVFPSKSTLTLGGDAYVSGYKTESGLPQSGAGIVMSLFFPNDSADAVIDFWDQPGGRIPMTKIGYRATHEMDLRIIDDDNWRWYWVLPATANDWSVYELDPGDLVLSGYQPDRAERPDPSAPNVTTVDSVVILLENSSDTDVDFGFWFFNEVPVPYAPLDSPVVEEMTLTYITDSSEVNFFLGDVFFSNTVPTTALPEYAPGVMPFSNVYDESGMVDSTNGIPYPGYQYPMIYSYDPVTNLEYLDNMVNFMYDSQVAYNTIIGELGPVASAFVWSLPGNESFGTPGTFTMMHWGTDVAWSGYQPRAFQAGARALEELKNQGYDSGNSITKLNTYLDNWLNWLHAYISQHGSTPTDFPSDEPSAPLTNDFTGHMTGLWLAGACHAYLAGHTNPHIPMIMDACFKELRDNYVNTGVAGHSMNGSWSPNVSTVNDNSMFFGFWAGEILRGLSLYVICKTKKPGTSTYLFN